MGNEMSFVIGMASILLIVLAIGAVAVVRRLTRKISEAEKAEVRSRAPRVFWFFRL